MSDSDDHVSDVDAFDVGVAPVVAVPAAPAIPAETASAAHARLGIVNRFKDFTSPDEAKSFLRKNVFVQSRGTPPKDHYG